MLKDRNQRAAATAFIAVLIIVLAIIGVAVFSLIKLLGGGEQMQRSTDSGNLSLVRAALVDINFPLPQNGNELQFNGVSDHTSGANGVINLRNINRVMAQSLLVTMNAFQIQQQGLDAGAVDHAHQTTIAAQLLGAQLNTTLATPKNARTPFNSLATNNSTGEWGSKADTAKGAPDFSWVDRGSASNVFVTEAQMPDWNGVSSKLYKDKVVGWTTQLRGDSAHQYLQGYINGLQPDKTYDNNYFVPLHPGDKPHLISQANFQSNHVPNGGAQAFSWVQPVPNSLSIGGSAKDSRGANGGFLAYGQMAPIANPGFAAAIPHGFIRILNGASSPATGVAGGSSDVFVYVMQDPQYYPVDKNGNGLPYFMGANEDGANYITKIGEDIKAGRTPDCSGLSVGFALAGDTIGLGGVSQENCNNIKPVSDPTKDSDIGNGGTAVDNKILDDPKSQVNKDMASYGPGDPQSLFARPPLQTAYNISPPRPTGSNGANVNVADSVNLAMLSARAEGVDFKSPNFQSGMANIPHGRAPLQSPNFIISDKRGASLVSTAPGGIPVGGAMWNFLLQRMYEIDPNWTSYTGGNLDTILGGDYVPMGGRAYIYYSQSAYGGKGGLTLKNEAAALTDAPWLNSFIGQPVDAKSPTNPTAVNQFQLANDDQIDLSGDWNFPHPYDNEGAICIVNWYSFTPSSGYNNLLGQLDVGATNTNCCPAGAVNTSFSVNYATGGDKVSIPPQCGCQSADGCNYSGPC